MSDDAPIRQIIHQCQEAWNRGDAAAFVASLASRVDFIDVLGRHHTDPRQIEAGHRHIFATIYQNSRIAYAVTQVRFLTPDVAVAFVEARLLCYMAGAVDDPNREAHAATATQREERARPTFIFQRIENAWKLVVFQNTRMATAG